MKISSDNTIRLFVRELGARKPSPGGGAAAALAGALGAALLLKTANYTIGKKKYEKYEKEAAKTARDVSSLAAMLLAHIEKDAKAYGEFSRTGSKAAAGKAARCAAEISCLSGKALKACKRLKKIGNRNFKGDIYTAELLLRASAKSAGKLADEG